MDSGIHRSRRANPRDGSGNPSGKPGVSSGIHRAAWIGGYDGFGYPSHMRGPPTHRDPNQVTDLAFMSALHGGGSGDRRGGGPRDCLDSAQREFSADRQPGDSSGGGDHEGDGYPGSQRPAEADRRADRRAADADAESAAEYVGQV